MEGPGTKDIWPGGGLAGALDWGSPPVYSPQGTAEPMVTVGMRGPGTGRSGCWGRGWTETRRSSSGEGLGGCPGAGAHDPSGCGLLCWELELSWPRTLILGQMAPQSLSRECVSPPLLGEALGAILS